MNASPRGSLDVRALRDAAWNRLPEFVDLLRSLVDVDSGSGDAEGVARVAGIAAERLLALGMSVALTPVDHPDGRPLGPVVVGRLAGALPDGGRVVLVGHLDTVFEPGTALERPFAVQGDHATGPGVCDDKGGVAAALVAAVLLAEGPGLPCRELVVVLVPDEEIGSPGSRALLEATVRGADAVLCVECAREDGSIVSARKGAADLVVTIQGRAAHAGIEPERGVNAALAAAHISLALDALADPAAGVTVNVGVIRAGSRANVVAPEGTVVADVRATSRLAFERVLAAARDVVASPGIEGARAQLEVRDPVPPMERSGGTAELVEAYRALALGVGLEVRDVATGGVADANVVAALGIPVLDGLGPIGGDDHSPREWLALSSVPERVALLAAMVAHVGTAGAVGPAVASGAPAGVGHGC